MPHQQLIVVVDGLVGFATNHGVSILPDPQWGFRFGGMFDIDSLQDQPEWPVVIRAFAQVYAADEERLVAAVQTAFDHIRDPHIVDACCGARGPLSDVGVISFEDCMAILGAHDARLASSRARAEARGGALRDRRAEFGARRSQLTLAMLDRGTPYKCAHPGCEVVAGLTIDHRIPISRGGTDDVENLQFMCRPHNSAKGDRI